MPDLPDFLERARERFPAPDLPLDDVYRRRDRNRRRQRIAAGVVGAAVFVAVLVVAGAMQRDRSSGPPGTDTPSISPDVVEPVADTRYDIYEVDVSTAELSTGKATLVSALPLSQTDPERSPDGSRIVYLQEVSEGSETSQIFVLDPDGTTRQLTDLPGGALTPTWSPDGQQIAFVARGDIYVMDADGGEPRQVPTKGAAKDPDWSPDGTMITFSRGTEEHSAIWLASVADGSEAQVTRSEWGDWTPAWSPDGEWIAFVRYEARHGGQLELNDSDLWLVRPDGSDEHRVVPGEAKEYEFAPTSPDDHFQGVLTWSPDGESIAFAGGHCGCITIVDAATGEMESVWPSVRDIGEISWSADGTILGSHAPLESSVFDDIR